MKPLQINKVYQLKMGFRVTVTVATPKLKYSKDMLVYIQSWPLYSCNSIKTFYFSTLYTTITHTKLKKKKNRISSTLLHKNTRIANWMGRSCTLK